MMRQVVFRNKSALTKLQAMVLVAVVLGATIIGVAYYYYVFQRGPTAPVVKEVVIGNLIPLTGGYAYLGDIVCKGIELAVKEINQQGGIKSLGGAKIRLVTYDAGSTAAEATSAFRRMLAMYPEMCALLQAWPSGYVIAVSEIAEREGIPLLCTAWADSITQRGFKYVFRFCPNSTTINKMSIPLLIKAAESVGVKVTKMGFAYDDNPATIGLINSLKEICKTLNLELVFDETWTAPLRDATPIVLKLKESKPDLLFIYAISSGDVLLILGKMREMGIKIPTVGYGGYFTTPQFLETTEPAIREGLIVITDWNLMKGQEEFERKYLSEYGGTFVPKDAAMMYAVTWALKEAIERAASTDPKKIRDALANIDITSGPATILYGRIRFKPNGDLETAFPLVAQWQGNKLVTVYPTQYATGTLIWPK